jgi:hypothetical protein
MNGRREEILKFRRCYQNTITKSSFLLAVVMAKNERVCNWKQEKIIKED